MSEKRNLLKELINGTIMEDGFEKCGYSDGEEYLIDAVIALCRELLNINAALFPKHEAKDAAHLESMMEAMLLRLHTLHEITIHTENDKEKF